ncbi:MAG: damage-control phosphatase ARMT1 family protein [Chloroflexota bacterium]
MDIPDSLRGRDSDTWQEETITERLPAIARRVIEENHLTPAQATAVSALADDMPSGHIRPLNDNSAPDSEQWSTWLQPYIGQNWLDVPWFWAEMYFFRRILEATGYFVPGVGFGLDPYYQQKNDSLSQAESGLMEMLKATAQPARRETIQGVLVQALWGNQADLSVWLSTDNGNSTSPVGGHLLVDDTLLVADQILTTRLATTRIDLVADNAGVEFATDLILIDFLLRRQLAQTIFLHIKPYPTFVSDATAPDLTSHLAYFQRSEMPELRIVGDRLVENIKLGRLRVRSHLFWVSPMAMWEMPADLRAIMDSSELILLKGDMNYRRLVGDRHWPYTTAVQAVPGVVNTPIFTLRVCKAEVAVGLQPDTLDKVYQSDPEWRTNGQWGMAQLHRPYSDR